MTSEPYRVAFSGTARRNLSEDVPRSVAEAALSLIFDGIAHNPHRRGRELSPPLVGVWKANTGTYRVLYVIDEQAHVVQIVRVVHRRDAYRR
ncbi:MAG: type II toxin-antitoxin system RelE/ParE family toxin [Actinobacteria bacterium]|nr:type II toxin-antitoxin system RelE/ParE family toxin [Actinomycetota bacterium]